MDPDKENKYDIKTTVNALHDSGIDIMEGPTAPQENEFSPAAAPQVGKVPTPTPVPSPAPASAPIFSQQDRPSAQTIIDGVLGIGSVKAQDVSSKNDPSIKPLRTFKSDAEEAVKYNNVSKISIAVAEQTRRETAPVPTDTPIEYVDGNKSSKVFIIILILGILLGIGAGAYYWFFMMPSQTTAPVVVKVPKGLVVKTLVPYDKVDTVNLGAGRDPLSTIGGKLVAADVPVGGLYALLVLPAGTTTAVTSSASLFTGTHMPDRLSRSISGDYMVGTYFRASSEPFIILKNTFFQNTFAGMLDWERDMRNDLIPLIRVSYKDEAVVKTDSDIFTDMVISNVNARILKNPAGNIILAYAFADKDTLVIATGTDALKYVMDKLLSVRVVQ